MTNSRSPYASPGWVDFTQRCSAHFGVAPDRYLETALKHTLYPHARLLSPLLIWIWPEFFSADRDFLYGVGQLWRQRDFHSEVKDFHHHPANRGFLRHVLRLRVSAGRVQALVNQLLADPSHYTGETPRVPERGPVAPPM